MRKSAALLLLPALLCGSCPSPESGGEQERDVHIPADLMGLVHAGSTTLIANSQNVKDEYDLLDEYGAVWMLTDFSWGSIQPESKKDALPENWNWSGFDNYVANGNSRNKKIFGALDYDVAWLHGGWSDNYTTIKDSVFNKDEQVRLYNDGHPDRCIIGAEEVAKFCAYVTATVSRYDGKHGHGKVDAWGIWNEPNLCPRFWTGTREQFYTLSKAAADAIRESQAGLPDSEKAVIIGGSMNTTADDEWIRGLFSSGAAKKLDYVAYHPYSLNERGTEGVYQEFRQKVDSAFRNKIWVTEVGYPTKGSYGTEVAEGRMPQMVTKTIVVLAAAGAQKIFWYHISDPMAARQDEKDSEDWFGLFSTKSDGSLIPKGGAAAYKLCAKYLPGKTWRADGFPGADAFPATVKSYYFEGGDGSRCLIAWNGSYKDAPQFDITIPGGGLLHNVVDAASEPVPETQAYKLVPSGENVLFFTWNE